jgi:predicted acetylornithine/succinylornithine family transaminase
MTYLKTETPSTVQQAQNYLAQTYSRPDFVLSHGRGMEVYDTDGKTYLDFVAGIAVMALGHSDPQFIEILQDAATKIVHVSNLYYTEPAPELAEKLCKKSFADRVFFCNSGAEANEACIKFARKFAYAHGHTDKTEIIAFEHAFHGRTIGALAMTPKAKYQDPFKPLMPNVTILPFNDSEAVKAAISDKTCAVFLEPIQGEGGIYAATPEFLQILRQLCDQYEALLIFDEVQCGLGRTGNLWAHEYAGVTPDLMSLAKPLAGGLPMGAALMTERVHSIINFGDHGSTFAGGALTARVANYVFDRLSDPMMLEHVRAMGDYLKTRLQEINSPHISGIRGRGLMIGFDLDFPSNDLIKAGYQAGFLLVNSGETTIRLVPPLIIQKQHIDALIDFLTTYLQTR